MVDNDWLCGFLADLLGKVVERPVVTETTALGAAYLAGLQTGVWASTDAIASQWQLERQFNPELEAALRERLIAGWQAAVKRVTTT